MQRPSKAGILRNGPLEAGGLWSETQLMGSGTGSEREKVASVGGGTSPASQGFSGYRHLPNGARKPETPQYKGRVATSTITARSTAMM